MSNKDIYKDLSDQINKKRNNSPYRLRRYVHRRQHQDFLEKISASDRVLDAGSGEGVLSIMLAKKGASVIGCEISEPNVAEASRLAIQECVKVSFVRGDAENLPFENESFDVVVSSHVLEHLPSFDRGLEEIYRVTKSRAIIAVPTCLNLCSFAVLGGDMFWVISRKSLFGVVKGFFRVVFGIFGEGVNEGYMGNMDLEHIFRYPWVVKRRIERAGFRVVSYEAATLCTPYISGLLPVVRYFDKYKHLPILRELGYGTTFVIEKKT